MEEWENLWSNKHFGLFYFLSILFPAGPWDFFWRWKRYKYFLSRIKLGNPDIVELGSGPGIMSIKMKTRFGGNLTLVDQSNAALDRAKELAKKTLNSSERENISYLNEDFFKIKNNGKYDIVHSQGLIEHFELDKIIKLHSNFAKKEGYVLVIAPRNSFMYRFVRSLIEKVYGKWPFGYEVPVEGRKVRKAMEDNGMRIIREKKFTFCYGCLAQKTR